jgi:hypothetical protein
MNICIDDQKNNKQRAEIVPFFCEPSSTVGEMNSSALPGLELCHLEYVGDRSSESQRQDFHRLVYHPSLVGALSLV